MAPLPPTLECQRRYNTRRNPQKDSLLWQGLCAVRWDDEGGKRGRPAGGISRKRQAASPPNVRTQPKRKVEATDLKREAVVTESGEATVALVTAGEKHSTPSEGAEPAVKHDAAATDCAVATLALATPGHPTTDSEQQIISVKIKEKEKKVLKPLLALCMMPSRMPESEVLAQGAVQSSTFTAEAVLAALSVAEITWSTTRGNVIPEGKAGVYGMLLGLFSFAGRIGVTTATTNHPWLTRLVIGFCTNLRKGFQFTSVQVNKNYASRLHVDANNVGKSLIYGLGNYSGGELWVEDGEGEEGMFLAEPVRSRFGYRAGEMYAGTLHDVRGQMVEFDGNRLHCTQNYEGERYTLVFYTNDQYLAATDEVRHGLAEAGFDFDWSSEETKDLLRKKALEREAVHRYYRSRRSDGTHQVASEPCLARTWNEGWGGQCRACRAPESDFCRAHGKNDIWKTHGRVDGVVPEAKGTEMRKRQAVLLSAGTLPPQPLPRGAAVLVEIAGWMLQPLIDEHPHFQGYQPPVDMRGSGDAETDFSGSQQPVGYEEMPRANKVRL
mmetsp:Transcript_43885/g.103793  ORF Transcript_43885/g.103793 Transcript_43885/m.103793 type:complete len:552 (-) Transcript_43885:78-1733(-)